MALNITPDVDVERDEEGNVTQLRHPREAFSTDAAYSTPETLAESYIQEVADIYSISSDEVVGLAESMPMVAGAPQATQATAAEGARLKRAEVKTLPGSAIVSYQQTAGGLPVWNARFNVIISGDPPSVRSSNSSLHKSWELPQMSPAALSPTDTEPTSLHEAIGVDDPTRDGFVCNGIRLLVYQYDPAERLEGHAMPPTGDEMSRDEDAGEPPSAEPYAPGGAGDHEGEGPGELPETDQPPTSMGPGGGEDDAGEIPEPGDVTPAAPLSEAPMQQTPPTLPLPPVPDHITPGHYVVREVLFSLNDPVWGELNWRAFVELESGAVLYLRALTAAATCRVFATDPVSNTGQPLTPASPAADLDNARTGSLPVLGLDPPSAGVQSLEGEYAAVLERNAPTIAPPTETSPFAFEYSATTDNFSAANAYFHTDAMYRLVQEFGFDVATYFDGTTFPVPVDHRGKNSQVNASANGNTSGNGMGKFLYGLAQSGQPVGIATTARVCLHEFGHALLWDHVNSPNFGWCHSAGDTLAAILHDPGSRAPDRFMTFPFITAGTPGIDRRHDRDVAAGWAFGGTRDDTQYGSEQILSTLMFRIYRTAGGDNPDIAEKRFSSRYLAFLIIKAIGQLTATTRDPRVYVNALMDADETTTSFEGHPGGAWHKLFRWSFEKQGLYQPAGAPTPVTGPGAPPAVDVYINDGRNGEYEPYLSDIGASPDVWNRRSADNGTTNQQPAAGRENYLYVRVRNRGTGTANDVRVKALAGAPGSALVWPTDWSPLTPAELSGSSIPSGGQTIVGPFRWTPASAGSISVLASASARGDSSNADTVNGPLPSGRLVPLDNNVAQRNFAVGAPAGACIRIASGSTRSGATNWRVYSRTGIYLDVDTSKGGFVSTPRYFTSIGGRSSHWATTGATSIYRPTPTGFRVYVRWHNGANLTPADANRLGWHINWVGVEE